MKRGASMLLIMLVGHCFAAEPKAQLQKDFRLALPGYTYSFPRDHAAHPEFRTEWWYFTGHLRNPQDVNFRFGYELTFFRNALRAKPITEKSSWSLRDLYFAHFAITDISQKKFFHSEKVNRGALGLAGAETNRVNVWVEDWKLRAEKDRWILDAQADHGSIHLQLTPKKKEVIHGTKGVSQKAQEVGRATHYVSFTRLETSGTIQVGKERLEVVGQSWYDHEFGSNQLTEEQVGWDWFSLQLDSGEELMIYLLRKKNGCFDLASSGTWIDRSGATTHLELKDISVLSVDQWKGPQSRAVYPSRWEIRIAKCKVSVLVEPVLKDQELRLKEPVTMKYWEGACRVTGSHSGRAYVELTGY
jgi:predicted secreted hydrolase